LREFDTLQPRRSAPQTNSNSLPLTGNAITIILIVIGHNGKIPWCGLAPLDVAFFTSCVSNSTLVMGRKTWEETKTTMTPGGGVPGCKTVVVTRDVEREVGGECVLERNYNEAVVRAFEIEMASR